MGKSPSFSPVSKILAAAAVALSANAGFWVATACCSTSGVTCSSGIVLRGFAAVRRTNTGFLVGADGEGGADGAAVGAEGAAVGADNGGGAEGVTRGADNGCGAEGATVGADGVAVGADNGGGAEGATVGAEGADAKSAESADPTVTKCTNGFERAHLFPKLL